MKKTFEMYAKYNQAGNRTVYGILSGMSAAEREKDRGSFYGSLSGLFRHVLGGTLFFLGLYRGALKDKAAAQKALAVLEGIKIPEGELSEAQWKELGKTADTVDSAYCALAGLLSDADYSLPLAIDWYGGKPPTVPLAFMFNQLIVHNTHHRGQISQILDSLKIDNDYSGIDVAFM